MRLHIISDLHLEFGAVQIPTTDADVVVLAGDVHLGREGRKWAQRNFPNQPVVYVLGNHEFYKNSIPELTQTLLRETSGSQIHLLENQAVVLDGVTFAGCTLWTDFRLANDPQTAMLAAEDIMNDYAVIEVRAQNRSLRARDTLKMHTHSVKWLKSELAKHDPARTLVVTHHGPSPRSIPPYHAGSPLNPAFASDLEELVQSSRVPLWIHGHTHYNVDYSIGSTRVLTNQRGYPDEHATGFDPGLTVEFPSSS
jgi:predicted phosphodiesterase